MVTKEDVYACRYCLGTKEFKIEDDNFEKINAEARAARKCLGCGRSLVVADMIKIIGPYIMIEPIQKEVKTKVGLIIPSTCWRVWRIGRVVRLGGPSVYWSQGGGKRNSFGQQVVEVPKGRMYHCPNVVVGDIVMFQDLAVRSINAGCNEYFLIHYDDVELKMDSMDDLMPM